MTVVVAVGVTVSVAVAVTVVVLVTVGWPVCGRDGRQNCCLCVHGRTLLH